MNDKDREMLMTVNMLDTVIYDNAQGHGPPSIRKGTVTLISKRGVNVTSPWGDKFIKWDHVKEIIKEKI